MFRFFHMEVLFLLGLERDSFKFLNKKKKIMFGWKLEIGLACFKKRTLNWDNTICSVLIQILKPVFKMIQAFIDPE